MVEHIFLTPLPLLIFDPRFRLQSPLRHRVQRTGDPRHVTVRLAPGKVVHVVQILFKDFVVLSKPQIVAALCELVSGYLL